MGVSCSCQGWISSLRMGLHPRGRPRAVTGRKEDKMTSNILKEGCVVNNADRRRRRTTVEMNLGQYLQPCPCPNGSRPWAAGELALLGTMTDHALALRLSRSVNAV